MEDKRLKLEKRHRKTKTKRSQRKLWKQGVNGKFRRERNSIDPEDLLSDFPEEE